MERNVMDRAGEKLIVTGRDGIRIFEKNEGNWEVIHHALEGEAFTSVCATSRLILAGSRSGIQRSMDFGRTWQGANQGLSVTYVRWMTIHPNEDLAFVGTEPAEIFRSNDGGLNWTSSANIEELRDRNGWFLPYSSGAGCVRGFDFHGIRGYAAVEVGGALWTNNAGETWSLVGGSSGVPSVGPPAGAGVHADVHSIQTHPSSPELVYAPTGGGFFRSWDGGVTWDLRYRCYCRAAWIDPLDPEHIVLGPADSVDRVGRIEESVDGGAHWVEITEDLETPWPRHMVERFIPVGDSLLAILSNGEMLSSRINPWGWSRFQSEFTGATAAAYVTMEMGGSD
jgi:photosystem II stability/assembly factor-like uncharacterized protein